MKIRIFESAGQIGEYAAKAIAGLAARKPDAVIGFATGSSPLPIYDAMIRLHRSGELDCSGITTFNLDEYVGLGADHPQSFAFFMRETLFGPLGIEERQINRLDGAAKDPPEECRRYERVLEEKGPIDIQILGVGGNGHIGFNEPGEAFSAHVHIESLTPETIEANKRFFKDAAAVPQTAMTMGIANILAAKKILLIAAGRSKAQAIQWIAQGPEDPRVPGSALRRHPDVEILLDRDAASMLGGGDKS